MLKNGGGKVLGETVNMPSPKTRTLFISYSSSDAGRVDRIAWVGAARCDWSMMLP
jgi:hypothetical protein